MPDTLTFAFTDIVDSTAKNLAIGDAAYVAVAAQHDALIRSIAPDAELKTIGDSFMLRFRDPAEAVGKLVEVQRRLAERPIKIGSESLAVRIGIHLGNPLAVPGAVGQEDYRGTTVNQAARYESLARGGQILISEEVHFLVKDRPHELPGISYHDWGPYYLKGVGWRKVIEVLWNGKAPVAPSGRPQHRSRRFLAPFIGREKELNDIQRYLANPSFPLVTLKGPGGIGKTRLAGEIERRASQLFDDGTFFVELESTPNNPRDVEDQIRAKCGIDTGATEDFFVNKAALLILNTFESVISARNVVQQLLKSCGGLRILATSQVPLHIPGEQVWPVESLEADDAEKMFREYARRHDPGFEITPADREHVEELFRLTDRIPFCLELAAAKIRPGRSLQSIVAGIGQSLGTLGGEMESLRHKSVSACLDWSFSLLEKAEKELFPKLSVFRGGFVPAGVAAVCGAPDAERLLASLDDSSLLRLAGDRFFLLPTAGEYSAAKLGEARAGLRRQHAERYLAMLEAADRKARTREHQEAFAVLRGEFENLRTGMLWAVEVQENEIIVRYGQAFAGNLAPLRRAAAEVQFCEMALQAARRMADRVIEASAQNNLGSAYANLPTGDRGENVRQAIACCEAALGVYTERGFPEDWARTQNNLGNAYQNLPTGDRAGNLRKAIHCYGAALRVGTEKDFPVDWASTQNNLGNAYAKLPTGDRGENLRQAIACYKAALHVYTERGFPVDWAMTQNNLGIAYRVLPTGDRVENLRRAIACYEAALRVYTERDSPVDWAMTQNNLGGAYWSLPAGDRAANLLKAIHCCEAALRVHTERDFPVEWATTQNNLGSAYSDLPTGDRGENLRKAIQCYEAALRVHTERDFPVEWAMTQNNLGSAYANLPTGDRAGNLRKAIQCYEAALRVRTERDFPVEWATTQTNLGSAYSDLPTGDRGENLRKAIQCYGAALRVRTERDFPVDWAMTQNNLGNAYADLPTGDRGENLRQAIACFENAERGYRAAHLENDASEVGLLITKLKARAT
jgi:predicted ATPase/class 3 adenylate cyclase